MIEQLLDLEDITLYPAELNQGYQKGKYNFAVKDELDGCISLPIFANGYDVVDTTNYGEFDKNGIRPVLSRGENINTRLEGCQYYFCSFSINEIKEHFINHGKRNSSGIFRINIDTNNGADIEIFNTITELKKLYGPQVNIMGGSIGNPKTYINYCKAGADYVRVGLNNCFLGRDDFGFLYPMASLLIDITGVRNTSCVGLKQSKVIAEGNISSPIQILKAIALGADYVMIGNAFACCIEACGTLYVKIGQRDALEKITKEDAIKRIKDDGVREADIKRLYQSNSNFYNSTSDPVHDPIFENQFSNNKAVTITGNLNDWLKTMYNAFNYAFTMSNASDWRLYKQNIRYGRI